MTFSLERLLKQFYQRIVLPKIKESTISPDFHVIFSENYKNKIVLSGFLTHNSNNVIGVSSSEIGQLERSEHEPRELIYILMQRAGKSLLISVTR